MEIVGNAESLEGLRVEYLEAAVTGLKRLDDVGPYALNILAMWRTRKGEIRPQDIEHAESIVRTIRERIRLICLRIVGSGLADASRATTPLDEIEEQLNQWLTQLKGPDAPSSRQAGRLGSVLLLECETTLQAVIASLTDEINVARGGSRVAQRKPGRPQEAKHRQIYEEIRRLRDCLKETLGRRATWEHAVAAYNDTYKTKYTPDQVRQWGKRKRKRERNLPRRAA